MMRGRTRVGVGYACGALVLEIFQGIAAWWIGAMLAETVLVVRDLWPYTGNV